MTAKTKAPAAAEKLGTIEGLQFDIINAARLLQLIANTSTGELGALPMPVREAFLQVGYLGKMIEALYTEIHR